jgi:hypothetical protein
MGAYILLEPVKAGGRRIEPGPCDMDEQAAAALIDAGLAVLAEPEQPQQPEQPATSTRRKSART